MTDAPDLPGVRLVGRQFRHHCFLAYVANPEDNTETRVRVELPNLACDEHGKQRRPDCPHTLAVWPLTTPKENQR